MVEAKKSLSWHFYATKILPVGLFMALTLHFGNLVYLYLTVAFIQMLKASPAVRAVVAWAEAGPLGRQQLAAGRRCAAVVRSGCS